MAKNSKFQKSADGLEYYIGSVLRILFKNGSMDIILLQDGVYNFLGEWTYNGRKYLCAVEKRLPMLVISASPHSTETPVEASYYKMFVNKPVVIINEGPKIEGVLMSVYPQALYVQTSEGLAIIPVRGLIAVCSPQ
ncbi:hypothetical protein QIT50_gp25 [Pyrobaculum spherical virus 2]|uniref:Uncharacterized protein n=1 Tax=Pyrobaculum spherical virus 2 TaxID=2730632 RepID=A0A6M3VXU7_9VIRU|nr:hypothetical protein QIT50_gp25 [Pyrobaculum spherical virus 2]QJF12437.1 hypothetical protein PSV2_gp25 [Pyrobaculum spherical virus 2]